MSVFDELSKEELLEAAAQLTRMATTTERPSHASDFGGHKDPLVRKLAAVALHELCKPVEEGGHGLSYRELGKMFGCSASRVHALRKSLSDIDIEKEALENTG